MSNTTKNIPRRLLVTGATGGMGKACSLLGAEQGYHLILADLSEEKLAALANECTNAGTTAEYHVLDVTNPEHVENIVGVASNGGIDAIIHTVGISPTMAGWEKIVSVDLISTIDFLETLRPRINDGGAIVGITSISAYMCPANQNLESALQEPLASDLLEKLRSEEFSVMHDSGMAYAYSKKALKSYFAANARSWGREGKRLVSIAPGLIATEMGQQENAANAEGYKTMMSMIGIDRKGRAEDIANTALFLVSPQASYICGIDIVVDGGIIATLTESQKQKTAS